MTNPVYALGHSERELKRLNAQARLVGPFTRQFFQEAGVTTGMRVLEVGSGAGDTAFAAAELVGETGEVIGTDRVAAAVEAATERARALKLRNVSFREGNPAEMTFERPFDAVVGRYVLLFQADPAAMLRGLKRHLRPGGVIVFHEPDLSCVRSFPPAPTYDLCIRRLADVFRLLGTEANMAVRLYQAFVGAGLPTPYDANADIHRWRSGSRRFRAGVRRAYGTRDPGHGTAGRGDGGRDRDRNPGRADAAGSDLERQRDHRPLGNRGVVAGSLTSIARPPRHDHPFASACGG